MIWARGSVGRAPRSQRGGRGFDPLRVHHVGAKSALLRLIFFAKISRPPAPLLLLFRKKSRSAHLFGCKRPHNGSLSLPTFCELRELHSISQNRGFFAKPPVRSFRSVSFPKKVTLDSPARLLRLFKSSTPIATVFCATNFFWAPIYFKIFRRHLFCRMLTVESLDI